MISLSDSELAAVMEAARPIDPRERDQFLRDVAVELAKISRAPGLRSPPFNENISLVFGDDQLKRSNLAAASHQNGMCRLSAFSW